MEQVKQVEQKTNKNLSTSSKSDGGVKPLEVMGPVGPRSIGLFIGTGLLGFWFGVGAALGAKMVNSLEELISIK